MAFRWISLAERLVQHSLSQSCDGPAHRDMSGETLNVDVRAAGDHSNTLTPQPLGKRPHQRCGRGGGGGFNGKPRFPEQQVHANAELIVRNENDLLDRVPAKGEAVRQRIRRAQAVGDRRDMRVCGRLSLGEAAPHVVRALRLDTVDPTIGE